MSKKQLFIFLGWMILVNMACIGLFVGALHAISLIP